MEDMEKWFADARRRMETVIAVARKDLGAIRTGRANPALLERVEVEYYGARTPLNQLANITAPDARLLVVQPYDRNIIADIEKAILKADLGLTPSNDGQVIRLAIPQLTEERRKELVRVARKEIEDKRVAIRNVRRDLNDELRKAQKEGVLSEDDARRAQEQVQELTDAYIQQLDELLKVKEKEILEV